MLSSYFQQTLLLPYDIEKFKNDKKIRINKIKIEDKTVRQMLRNMNLILDYKYETVIISLVKYIHTSVLKLRKYKNNFDKNWWDDNKNNKKRSEFSLLKKKIVIDKKLLNINHFIFKKLKLIYNIENKSKDIIIEIVYYIYKINLKLLEYETINKLNTNVFIKYDNTWNNIFKKINNYNENKFNILFSGELKLNNKNINVFYKDKKMQCISNQKNIYGYYDLSRKYVEDDILKNNYDCIIEFGSGWGRNIFHYYNKISDKLKQSQVIGCEYTKHGLLCAEKIKNKYYNDKNVKFFHFDYNNPELFFEQLSLMGNFKNILCLSFWSIEQITNIKMVFFDILLKKNIKFIHHEPIGWQIDNSKSFMKENKTGNRSYYNKNLYKVLKNLEKDNKIQINNEKINYFNFMCKESMGSLIEWVKKS